MATDLCGVTTPLGPCTMRKGHSASWHRHREYEHCSWRILDSKGKVLDFGENIVPMNERIGFYRTQHKKLVIEIEIG